MNILFRRSSQVIASVVWLGGLAAAFGLMYRYQSTPGRSEPAPRLSSESCLDRNGARPQLLMFVHPRCPCTAGSLAELKEIISSRGSSISVTIVLVKPPGAPADWEQAFRTSVGASLPEIPIRIDDGGALARRHGAWTSGHVLLYDPEGRLLFSGGITRSRGHAGDNVGSRSIAALLDGESAEAATTPVFGCPLFTTTDCSASQSCERRQAAN